MKSQRKWVNQRKEIHGEMEKKVGKWFFFTRKDELFLNPFMFLRDRILFHFEEDWTGFLVIHVGVFLFCFF